MSEAVQADRVVVLRNGNVIADRIPREIFSDSELIREAGLELPPVIELREALGMPDSVMTSEDIITELRKQCR